MQEGPDRRGDKPARASAACSSTRASAQAPMAARGMRCLQGPARAVDDGDRHHPGDIPPATPAVEACQVVRAHDPDEIDTRIAPLEESQRIDGVAGTHRSLETRDVDAGMGAQRSRISDSLRQGGQFAVGFRGFPGVTSHQILSRRRRFRASRLTSRCPSWARIERPAIEPDPHPAGGAGKTG